MMQEKKIRSAPFLYTGFTVLQRQTVILVLLALQMLLMLFLNDYVAVTMIVLAGFGALSANSLILFLSSRKIVFNPYVLFIGLTIGFFVPSTIGFFFVFILSFVSIFLTYGLFGGHTSSWINPIMLAICISSVVYPEIFQKNSVTLDALVKHGSIFSVLQSFSLHTTQIDQSITSILNSVILHSMGVTLPEGYIGLFIQFPSEIPAFRYNLLTLFSGIILFATKVIDKITPSSFIITYATLVWLFSLTPITKTYGGGDVLVALLTSGVFFMAVFVLSDNSTSCRTRGGQLASGIILGIFTFLLVGPGGSIVGLPFAVLITNMINPLIEKMEYLFFRRMRERYDNRN